MPGIWLTRLARRLTHDETFERLVSPAIADLQREAARGVLTRISHYIAIGIVFVCAALRDFRADMASAFDADARRTVWTRAAVWALAAGVFNWLVLYALTLRSLSQWSVDESVARVILSGVVFKSIVPALTVAAIVAAYRLKRRHAAPTRTVTAATVALAAAAFMAAYAAHVLQAPADHAMAMAGRTIYPERILVARPPLLWQMTMTALHMVPFAWLGVVLARHRGWPLAFSATAILGGFTLMNVAGLNPFLTLAQVVPSLWPILYGTYRAPTEFITLMGLIALWRAMESRIYGPRLADAH